MKFSRLAAGLLLAAHAAFALAQGAYPDKPVRIIVPFSPGGGGDVNGRLIANKLSERFKQSFVVDNRAGAGGNIGTVALKQAAPDGYTLLLEGYPELEASAWYGIVAPAGTPPRILETLSTALREILAQPDTQRQMAVVGAEPFQLDHQEFARFMDREGTLWAKVIQRSAIRVD